MLWIVSNALVTSTSTNGRNVVEEMLTNALVTSTSTNGRNVVDCDNALVTSTSTNGRNVVDCEQCVGNFYFYEWKKCCGL